MVKWQISPAVTVFVPPKICLFVFSSELDAPFARWSREQVCDWMQEQGLGLYVSLARQWVASGQTLLQASQQDLERVSSYFSESG